MRPSHQDYADLAAHSYQPLSPGVRQIGSGEKIEIGETTYEVIEHVSRPVSGYQGTIYRNLETGDFVVAHRGTEVNSGAKAIVQDALFTDGSMAMSRVNPQAEEAIALTRRAVELAESIAEEKGKKPKSPSRATVSAAATPRSRRTISISKAKPSTRMAR